jgi:uncharacterized protein (DUF305 family)
MKTKIITTIIFLLGIFGIACNTQNSATNNNSHAGMDHNSMNMSPTNQNTVNNQTMNHSEMNHSEMKSSPNAANAVYDLQFLDTMIAHHQGAVEMAKMIDAKASHAELKTLGKNIITSQEKEISEMKSWRENRFAGKEPALNMEMAGMSDSMKGMDMKKLDSLSGNAFDLEFIKQMIPHHEGAVVMAKEALQKSQKEEVKALAKAIIKDQDIEIQQMKTWLAAWSK